ncbi:Protein of unknown function [Pyronema omphalodes CBS 100304]|uniref:Uncharacterized protein n=1 Tax=Pyronema omphalodes (strain CBS 100304) TaxID=1076935 RepID=U4LK01_PYROM|nr:Protein of unknown function [Pyronema omphalodes CBS 100304]
MKDELGVAGLGGIAVQAIRRAWKGLRHFFLSSLLYHPDHLQSYRPSTPGSKRKQP